MSWQPTALVRAVAVLASVLGCGRVGFDSTSGGVHSDGGGGGGDGSTVGPCGDIDHDTCDDCSSGSFDPGNDGPDDDGDGLCNAVANCPVVFLASRDASGTLTINGCSGVAASASPRLKMSTSASAPCAGVTIGDSIVVPLGTVEASFVLDRAAEPFVNDMANCVTDGNDETVQVSVFDGRGYAESTFFGVAPDLIGNRIVEFRQTVHSVDGSYNANQARCSYSWSLTWEVWGHQPGCP